MLMSKMLNAGGYHNLHSVLSAGEAFDLLGIGDTPVQDAIGVDLILMDMMMPGIDGIEACERIKADARFAGVPIVIVTSKDDLDSVAEAFGNGVVDYLVKPLSQVEMLARVHSILLLKNEIKRRKSLEMEIASLSAQLVAANQLLARQDCVDVLTGLNNRRYLEALLAEEWRRGMREALPVSLICIDIDDFKGYNLAKGYPAGDDCLRQVAGALSEAMGRAGDVVVRYGGEEFAVLLPNTDHAGVVARAEEFRARIAALDIVYDKGFDGWLTVGMGLATVLPRPETTHHQLLAAADEALTLAKEAGPGQIMFREA